MREPRRSIFFAPPPRAILVLLVGLLVALGASYAAFARRVHDLRARRATGPAWSFPSRVYAADVPLTRGRVLPRPWLVAQLAARGYRVATAPVTVPGTYATTESGAEVFLRGFLDAPDPDGVGGPERVGLRIEGAVLTAVSRLGGMAGAPAPDLGHPPRLEPTLIALLFDEGRVRRSWVSLHRVPRVVQDAIIASEDRRFRRHLGIDPRANARALVRNVQAGEVREGGSTITQQLARALFLGSERTMVRKVLEVPLALGLEAALRKDQILEMYLNGVYLGQAGTIGIGGVAEAARWYFDLPVDSLRLPQAALLAGLIPAPNLFDPIEHPAAARARRDEVLDDMVAAGVLSGSARDAAQALPLGVRRGPPPAERFPSFCGYVRSRIDDDLRRNAAAGWGLDVFTTMDLVGQAQAEQEVARALARLGRRLQGAFVALDPATGAVRVMVGGRGGVEGDYNRAYQARRQTGSAIKPIVYAAALSAGSGSFSPASTVSDTLRTYGQGRHAWRPVNYDGRYHESVTLALALAHSRNVATTNLVEMIGPSTVADLAQRMGLGRLKPVLSIGLGSNETSLLALTNAYAAFAAAGVMRPATPIRAVVDGSGEVMVATSQASEDVLSPGIAAVMTGLLENVVVSGVAHPLRSVYGFDRPVAGKTGTTNDFRDAWFVGYVPQLVAGAWVGYDRPRSIGRPAAHVAIPVWAAAMRRLVANLPPEEFASDRDLEHVTIDPWTGLVADTTCPRMTVGFIYGTAPTMVCDHTLMAGYDLAVLDSLWDQDTAWTEPDTVDVDVDRDDGDPAWPEPEDEPEEPGDEPGDDPLAPPDTTDQDDVVPDDDAAARCAPEGLDEVLRAAGDPERVTLLRWQQLWTRRSWSLA